MNIAARTASWAAEDIPYQRIEYLGGDGSSAYIDTGLLISNNSGFEIELSFQYMSSHWQAAFGCRTTQTVETRGWLFQNQTSYAKNGRFYILGANTSQGQAELSCYVGVFCKVKYISAGTSGVLTTVEGGEQASYSLTTDTWISARTVSLFCGNYSDTLSASPSEFSTVRIKRFTIFNLSNVIADFIPVRVGQVGYMYERISKRLVANAGSGSFVLGPDV